VVFLKGNLSATAHMADEGLGLWFSNLKKPRLITCVDATKAAQSLTATTRTYTWTGNLNNMC